MATVKEFEYDPVKELKGNEKALAVVWSTKSLTIAVEAIKKGLPLKANPFIGPNTRLLRPDLVYKRTEEEIEDYIRCKEDVKYFATKCFLMTPEGLQPVKLRDYLEDYLDHLTKHKFSIFKSCRQSGKCNSLITNVLCKFIKPLIQLNNYKINNNIYNLPLFELYNLYCKLTISWKLEYKIYKLLYENLNNKYIYNCLIFYLSILDSFRKKTSDKFIDSILLKDKILIYTDKGYKNISYIHLTKPFEQYILTLENGYTLNCADNHIVFDKNYNEIFVKDLYVGDEIITDCGPKKILCININNLKISMCDLTVDDPIHRFYSNGILSHNSTTTAIFALHTVLFNVDMSALVLSKSGPAGIDLISKIKDMFLYLPYYLKCGITKWNQHEIAFDNNSKIGTESFSDTAGLGQTLNFLILDEFAWCNPNQVELFYNNVIPTISTLPNAHVCIMSTQNGFNFFAKLWNIAIKGESTYAPFLVDWWQVPQYDLEHHCWRKRDEEWKQKMIGILGGEAEFEYQYGTAFSSSDKCILSRNRLSKIKENEYLFTNKDTFIHNSYNILYSEFLYIDDKYLIEEVLLNGWFVILVDLAEGGGGDYTVFNIILIIDDNDFRQIGYWHANTIDLENAALGFWIMYALLFNAGRTYISIEWNTYGQLFYNFLMNLNEEDYQQENSYRFGFAPDGIDLSYIVYYQRSLLDLSKTPENQNLKLMPGIRFSKNSKAAACKLLKLLLESSKLKVYDIRTILELENFEDKNGNGSYAATYGHDDIVMTFNQIPMFQLTAQYKEMIEDKKAFETGLLYQEYDNNYLGDKQNFLLPGQGMFLQLGNGPLF